MEEGPFMANSDRYNWHRSICNCTQLYMYYYIKLYPIHHLQYRKTNIHYFPPWKNIKKGKRILSLLKFSEVPKCVQICLYVHLSAVYFFFLRGCPVVLRYSSLVLVFSLGLEMDSNSARPWITGMGRTSRLVSLSPQGQWYTFPYSILSKEFDTLKLISVRILVFLNKETRTHNCSKPQ